MDLYNIVMGLCGLIMIGAAFFGMAFRAFVSGHGPQAGLPFPKHRQAAHVPQADAKESSPAQH